MKFYHSRISESRTEESAATVCCGGAYSLRKLDGVEVHAELKWRGTCCKYVAGKIYSDRYKSPLTGHGFVDRPRGRGMFNLGCSYNAGCAYAFMVHAQRLYLQEII